MKCNYLWLLFIVVLASCRIKDKQVPQNRPAVATNAYTPYFNQINEAVLIVKDGDLIVRSGTDMVSQMIKNFNQQDKSYSHAGLIFLENGSPKVFHILAGDENPGNKLIADSLTKFCHPRHNSGFAIYRYDMNSDEISKLKQAVLNWRTQGVSFDSAFNLKTDDRMYCSEMIKKGLANATQKKIVIQTRKPSELEAKLIATKLPLPLATILKTPVVSVDNLYTNPHCRLIQRYDFNQQK